MFILIDLTEIFWKNLQPMKNFPHSSVGKESTCNVGDLGSIPGLGRFPGEGKTYPLQYSGLENSMDYTDHGIIQARILEWVGFPFSRGSSQLRDQTQASHIVYLRLLIFLLAILIPACASSSLAFHTLYSTC